jgi:hypothetical protein
MKPIVYAALAGWTLWASIGGAQAAQIRSPFLDHPVDLAALESVLSAQPEDLVQAVQKMKTKMMKIMVKKLKNLNLMMKMKKMRMNNFHEEKRRN